MIEKLSEAETTSQVTDQEVETVTENEESGGPGVSRMVMYFVGGGVGFILIGFIIAFIFALTNPAAATGFQIIRDFFIIVMALEGIIVVAALAILVLQLARLTNLLQNEIKPILDQANETVSTVKGTASFVGQNIADPVIRASGFFSWVLAFFRELFGIRRALRQTQDRQETPEPSASEGGGDE